MFENERRQADLDLTPQLEYARPEPPRPWMEMADDVLDVVGGWLGLTIIVGVYAILLAPWFGMLAAFPLLLGFVLLQAAFVYWLKKV